MTALPPSPAVRATLHFADEAAARRAADIVSESLDAATSGIALFEADGGGWDVTVYLESADDAAHARAAITQAADAATADALAFEPMPDRDWVAASLEGLVPVSAGRFVIHGGHDRHRVRANQFGVEIEAALAFGTGHHGTTRGCLLLLDDALKDLRPRRVLDLGTGTGVLAIAAAKALRQRVLATDIDARSADVARENARLNGVGGLVRPIHATGFHAPAFRSEGPFDLVLANILANPLRMLAPAMARHLAPRARVILSGLLPHQAKAVVAAYRAQGLRLTRRRDLEGWTSLLLKRC